MRRVYLDHNATTPLHPEVKAAMLPYFDQFFGNASSIHSFGREARAAVDEARERVAALIGAEPAEIIFTSGGTESDNFAIKGLAYQNSHRGKGNHIITTSIEHHAVTNSCDYLQKRGFEITYVRVDKFGIVEPEEVKKAIKSTTILVSVMHANNEIGSIEPIEEIGRICRENNVPFHTDAVQSYGKIPIDVKQMNLDMLSLSGHKIYGPKGVGAIYISRRIRPFDNLLHGGQHERNRRGGTENVPGIVGLGKAAELAKAYMTEESEHLYRLTKRLKEGIFERIDKVTQNGHPERRLPGTLNFTFAGVGGESLILSLDMEGICVSTGSACSSGSLEPSHVLAAIGLTPEMIQGSARFSLGRRNTEEDIDYVLDRLPQVIKRLRMTRL
jgi:cysteine desulfurase